MERAYSVLQVKSFDPSGRRFSGMATTPTPDRVDDVIEPFGVTFAKSMPLMLFHHHDEPVGTVMFGRPGKDGIPFDAYIPEVTEEGEVKKLTDKAAHFVKYGLIRAVSIGFRSLNGAVKFLKSGGRHFLETEVIETSLVAIPANQEAVISVVKSIDREWLAASGAVDGPVARPSAGVSAQVNSGTQKGVRTMPKSIHDQIDSYNAQRQAKSASMSEIMEKAATDGVTLDQAQSDTYDTLETEVKALDAHLSRLDTMQKAQTIRPVVATTPAEAAASRTGQPVISVKDNLPPGIGFARAVKAAVVASLDRRNMFDVAKEMYPSDNRLHGHIKHVMELPRIISVMKAAVAAGTTTQADWASALVDPTNLASEFIEYLRPATIIGKLQLRPVPFNIRMIEQTQGGTGYWVGQGASKPLTSFGFAPVTLGHTKVAAISVITEELARFSTPSAEALVRDALRDAIVERIDMDLLDPTAAAIANVQPASLTNGLTALSSAGTSADNIRTDLGRLLQTFVGAKIRGRIALVMPESLALTASLMSNALGQPEFQNLTGDGGTIRGLRVITSQYVANSSGAGNMVVAIAENEVYLADDGGVTIDASREASLQMLDNPTNNSATATATTMVSMWQTNSIALRAERFINWSKRRDAAVAFMDDVNWGSVGSP